GSCICLGPRGRRALLGSDPPRVGRTGLVRLSERAFGESIKNRPTDFDYQLSAPLAQQRKFKTVAATDDSCEVPLPGSGRQKSPRRAGLSYPARFAAVSVPCVPPHAA